MTRRLDLMFSLAVVVMLVFASGCAGPTGLKRYDYAQIVMGVRAFVAVYSPDEESARAGARAAFDAMNRLDAAMSDYRPDSELSRVNAAAGKGSSPIGPDLADALRRALEFSAETNGAFDATCGPVVKLWREARRAGRLPNADELALARTRVGWRMVRLYRSGDADQAELAAPGMMLDLGGIGKGFAADRARRALDEAGLTRCLVGLSGDLSVGEPPPGTDGWRIGVTGAEAGETGGVGPDSSSIVVTNVGVSTSGDAEQFLEVDGVRYSHIVDPRTGLGVTNPIQATVVARTATESDALSTAVCVLGAVRGRSMIEAHAWASVRMVLGRGEDRRIEASRGFPKVDP